VDREIPTFLLQMHREGASFRALVRAALARGVPVDDLLGRIEFDDQTELFEAADGPHLVLPFPEEGWLDVLCEELGGDDGAQEVLGRSSGWMAAHTVAGWRSSWAASAELDSAKAAGDPGRLDLAVALGLEILTPGQVEHTLREVVRTWPLAAQ
jgi:hypothetical protein